MTGSGLLGHVRVEAGQDRIGHLPLVVVRRDDEYRVGPRFGGLFREPDRLRRRLGAGPGDDRFLPLGPGADEPHQLFLFRGRKQDELPVGTHDHDPLQVGAQPEIEILLHLVIGDLPARKRRRDGGVDTMQFEHGTTSFLFFLC